MQRRKPILEGGRLRADRLHPAIAIGLCLAMLAGHRLAIGGIRNALSDPVAVATIDVSSFASDRPSIVAGNGHGKVTIAKLP